MADELVDTREEVLVGFRLDVEGRRPEGRRMQPGPGLRCGHRLAEEVRGGGGPARRGEGAEAPAFAVDRVRVAGAGQGRGRLSVVLDAEENLALGRPRAHGGEEALLVKLGEGAAEVAPEGLGPVADVVLE